MCACLGSYPYLSPDLLFGLLCRIACIYMYVCICYVYVYMYTDAGTDMYMYNMYVCEYVCIYRNTHRIH